VSDDDVSFVIGTVISAGAITYLNTGPYLTITNAAPGPVLEYNSGPGLSVAEVGRTGLRAALANPMTGAALGAFITAADDIINHPQASDQAIAIDAGYSLVLGAVSGFAGYAAGAWLTTAIATGAIAIAGGTLLAVAAPVVLGILVGVAVGWALSNMFKRPPLTG
jgi:hypothetical protein